MPIEFILNYMNTPEGETRFLTYTAYRFLSAAAKLDNQLPYQLKQYFSFSCTLADFDTLEEFLAKDDYFSPSLELDSFDPLCLALVLHIMNGENEDDRIAFDQLITDVCPAAASLSYDGNDVNLAAILTDTASYYGALYLAATCHRERFSAILPLFAEAYHSGLAFTCDDFLLYEFMDEYFEEKNCRQHPAFQELTDTLIAATLNYYDTDFATLIDKECTSMLSGRSSRFSGMLPFGTVQLNPDPDKDAACHMLAKLFRYAALYELRNNLFDFHLEGDTLITLDNWKEKLRWHYVQYANVYQMALDSFYTASLSRELLKKQYKENLAAL